MKLFKHLTANDIKLSRFDFKRELSMEAYLIENSDILILDDDIFSEVEIIDDELPIKKGRKTTDGRIDLLALYNENTYGIIELKKDELSDAHLDQLTDYMKEKEQIFEIIKQKNNPETKEEIKWIGILVGTSITDKLKTKIEAGHVIDDSIPVAALVINRYRGEDNQIYVLTETFFKNISKKYDRTKYMFLGQIYGKNRLVLAVIKKFIEDNPNISYSELKNIFPNKIQGSQYGVFTNIDDANSIINKTQHKRHFVKSNEVITLKDNTIIAVCTQWGIQKIGKFLEKAKELNYKIDKI